MSTIVTPVAVHMWFADGEGWAFHPKLEPQIKRIKKAVAAIIKRGPPTKREEFTVDYADGCLVGERFPDTECLDERAARRHPFLLRCVYVSSSHDIATEEVLARLRELERPSGRGEQEKLQIVLSELEPVKDDSSDVVPVFARSPDRSNQLGEIPPPETGSVVSAPPSATHPHRPSPGTNTFSKSRSKSDSKATIQVLQSEIKGLRASLEKQCEQVRLLNDKLGTARRELGQQNEAKRATDVDLEKTITTLMFYLLMCLICGGFALVGSIFQFLYWIVWYCTCAAVLSAFVGIVHCFLSQRVR